MPQQQNHEMAEEATDMKLKALHLELAARYETLPSDPNVQASGMG
jgi:hypothetical protein